jgi:hypothetical protein
MLNGNDDFIEELNKNISMIVEIDIDPDQKIELDNLNMVFVINLGQKIANYLGDDKNSILVFRKYTCSKCDEIVWSIEFEEPYCQIP